MSATEKLERNFRFKLLFKKKIKEVLTMGRESKFEKMNLEI